MDIWKRYYLKNISVNSSKNSSNIFVKGHIVKNGILRFTKVSLNSFSDQKGMRYAIFLRQKLIVFNCCFFMKAILGFMLKKQWRNLTDFDMVTRMNSKLYQIKVIVVNVIHKYLNRRNPWSLGCIPLKIKIVIFVTKIYFSSHTGDQRVVNLPQYKNKNYILLDDETFDFV